MIPVDLVCDVTTPGGYAAHARSMIRALSPAVDLRLVEYQYGVASVPLPSSERRALSRLRRKLRRPRVRIELHTPEVFRPDPRCFNVGFVHWETTRIPGPDPIAHRRHDWVGQMNSMDAIWTSSETARCAFRESGVDVPIEVVLPPVDVDCFRPGLEPLAIEGLAPVDGASAERPLVVAAVAEWIQRKDLDSFLAATLDGFSGAEIHVLLKCSNRSKDPDRIRAMRTRLAAARRARKREDVPQVTLLAQQLSDVEMARLYASIDVLVNSSRGEGLCLPLAEAMASGCLVVSNAFSAPGEYIEDLDESGEKGTGLLVDYELVPISLSDDNNWYMPDQCWGQIDRTHLAAQIRRALEIARRAPAIRERMGREARATIVQRMSPSAVAAHMLALIEEGARRR